MSYSSFPNNNLWYIVFNKRTFPEHRFPNEFPNEITPEITQFSGACYVFVKRSFFGRSKFIICS